MSAADCWCEYVDIGVGEIKVAQHPGCPHCIEPPECTVLPNGQGPACDWDPDCRAHGVSQESGHFRRSEVCVVQVGLFQQTHETQWVCGTEGMLEHCAVCGRLKP